MQFWFKIRCNTALWWLSDALSSNGGGTVLCIKSLQRPLWPKSVMYDHVCYPACNVKHSWKKTFDVQNHLFPVLTTHLPGKTIAQSPVTMHDLYNVGKLAASMNKTLRQLVSPNLVVLQRDDCLWNVSNLPLVEGYLSVMDGDPLQGVIKAVIDQFISNVQPKTSSFQKACEFTPPSSM
uniref:Uncharacterized protein n=1 Tax=Scophthalmus maximus TaxID=52904 RepID=A0A8D3BWC0_SCOMX